MLTGPDATQTCRSFIEDLVNRSLLTSYTDFEQRTGDPNLLPQVCAFTQPNVTVTWRDKSGAALVDGEVCGYFQNKFEPLLGYMGIDSDKARTAHGSAAKITSVALGSPAEKAGLLIGDLVTQVGQFPIAGPDDITKADRALSPGTHVTVTFIRDGASYSTDLVIGKRP